MVFRLILSRFYVMVWLETSTDEKVVCAKADVPVRAVKLAVS